LIVLSGCKKPSIDELELELLSIDCNDTQKMEIIEFVESLRRRIQFTFLTDEHSRIALKDYKKQMASCLTEE